jgi:hypothetical protein
MLKVKNSAENFERETFEKKAILIGKMSLAFP